MTNGGDENIAIVVSTTASGSGLREARTELGSLGAEAKRTSAQLVESSTQAASAENTLANAAAKTATATDKLTVSAEKMRDALARTGGDLAKAAHLVAAEAAAELQLAKAKDEVTVATDRETGAKEDAAVVDEKALRRMALLQDAASREDAARTAAAAREIQRRGALEVAAYREAAAREDAARRAEAAEERAAVAAAKVPHSARSAANALGVLSQATLTGNGSMASMATTAGGLASSLAMVSTNAKLAAGAAGIGALITVGVLLYERYKKAKAEVSGTVNAAFTDHLGNITINNAEQALRDAAQKKDRAFEAARNAATGDIRDLISSSDSGKAQQAYADTQAEYSALFKKVTELRQAERLRHLELAQSSRDEIASNRLTLQLETDRLATARDAAAYSRLAVIDKTSLSKAQREFVDGYKNEYQLSLEANALEKRQRDEDIRQQFRHRDANGKLVELTDEEVRLRSTLLDQNEKIAAAKGRQLQADYAIALQTATAQRLQGSENVGDRVRGRLEEIELERQAEIKRLGDVEGATRNAEQKKRALYKETARLAGENLHTMSEVFRSSHDKTLKAVGTFGENVRRVIVGAEAARALVSAAREGAEAIASLAVGDFRGAALHGAAAAEFGAAAALGARESLGGGGSGSAGAGSGGGSATFTPRTEGGAGNVTVVLQTIDPYSGEKIREVSYLLNRNGTLNRPIYAPATNGLALAGT